MVKEIIIFMAILCAIPLMKAELSNVSIETEEPCYVGELCTINLEAFDKLGNLINLDDIISNNSNLNSWYFENGTYKNSFIPNSTEFLEILSIKGENSILQNFTLNISEKGFFKNKLNKLDEWVSDKTNMPYIIFICMAIFIVLIIFTLGLGTK